MIPNTSSRHGIAANDGGEQIGEIVVYNVKDKEIPIVHRVVRKFGNG